MIKKKRCSVCRRNKALVLFWRDYRKPDGRQSICASCRGKQQRKVKWPGLGRRGRPPKQPQPPDVDIQTRHEIMVALAPLMELPRDLR